MIIPKRGYPLPVIGFVAILIVSGTPTTCSTHTPQLTAAATSISSPANFNCPKDCACTVVHTSFLHAKCGSLHSLISDELLHTTLPVNSIDLSHLHLTRLSHAFEKLTIITSIDLSHNDLHVIGNLGRSIKKLNLRHNHIPSEKLTEIPENVQVLNLQFNDITYLPLQLTRLTQLRSLELSHNPINCSCETLYVRNWLQERHVFMENPVACTSPSKVRGKSWLQVKQSEICEEENRNDLNILAIENELMLNDQPVEGSSDNDDDEELGKAFMPIAMPLMEKYVETKDSGLESSGDVSETVHPLSIETTAPTDDAEADEGSGSGSQMLIFPYLHGLQEELYDKTKFDEEKKTPTDIFGTGLGIFHGHPSGDMVPTVNQTQQESSPTNNEVMLSPQDGNAQNTVKHASVRKQDDGSATYFLLGVILLIVVGLILYVGIKRCKLNRNRAHDAENSRQTEMFSMDKKNPIYHNGMENHPLIAEKCNADRARIQNGSNKPLDQSKEIQNGETQKMPLLNGSAAVINETMINDNVPALFSDPIEERIPREYYPITPRYPTPKSPRASKYAQYPQDEPNNNIGDDTLPSSPKPGRYSPVYSPETGRVKIKLSETPKPKTPMLVTRTKSTTGSFVCSPIRLGTINNGDTLTNRTVPEHQVAESVNNSYQ